MMDYVLHGGLTRDLDAPQMLQSIRIGSLEDDITKLRYYHRDTVLSENELLDEGTARRLCREYGYMDTREVQSLWKAFVSPSPWKILLTSTLSHPIWFHRAFCPVVFPRSVRDTWRGHGLFSGVFDRLFQMLDTRGSGRLSFDNFLSGIALFRIASLSQRMRFCFDFADVDGDNKVTRSELTKMFTSLHDMYNGRSSDGAATSEASLFCAMIFEKAASMRERERERENENEIENEKCQVKALLFDEFVLVISLHPLTKIFFRLEEPVDSDSDVEIM